MIRRKYFKQLLFIALLSGLGARLYFHFSIDGFIITFTSIILALALFFNDDIHPIHLGLTVAFVSPCIRWLIDFSLDHNGYALFLKVYPDIFFYLTYGLIFHMIRRILDLKYKPYFFYVAFLSDFLSNFVELLLRTQIWGLRWEMLQNIAWIALGRTIVLMIIIYFVINYTTLLVKQEHEKRYHYLMMLSARFKSEIYFLYKNMNQIESLVSLSHQIKKIADNDTVLKSLVLELAKGTHEIKKDYFRVIQGLEDIYDSELDLEVMTMKDLFSILEANTIKYIKSKNMNIACHFKCRVDCIVKEHFYLMSILRNLINNSIDACNSESGVIEINAESKDSIILIYVKDNGTGIPTNELDFIFNCGYSSKFNEETGHIFRGIGLTLVQDMVENTFKGKIDLETSQLKGTVFKLQLPSTILKGDPNYEILYS